jgi:metallopeptidase MepB
VCKLEVYCALTDRNAIPRSMSLFDFKIHNLSGDQALADLDMRRVWYDTREELESMDFSLCRQEGADLVSFNHLTAGMDSGYYAYLW